MNEAVTNELIGCYVTGSLVADGYPRQGVFVYDCGNGTVLLVGKRGQYICKGPEDVTYVKTIICESTREHIKTQRQLISVGFYE